MRYDRLRSIGGEDTKCGGELGDAGGEISVSVELDSEMDSPEEMEGGRMRELWKNFFSQFL